MSDFEPHRDNHQQETESYKRLEEQMREKFLALEEAQGKIAVSYSELKTIETAYESQHPRPKEYSEEWYSAQDADPELKHARSKWKEAMRHFGEGVVAAMEAQRKAAELIHVPDGEYKSRVRFTGRNVEDTVKELSNVQMHTSTLAGIISHVQADISMEGIHNMGFRVPPDIYKGAQVSYEIDGPEDFVFRSRCYVDQGGQILQGAWQFR